MPVTLSRRTFGAAAAAAVAAPLAAPFVSRAEAAAPLLLRCSLDTEPSHPRNVAFRDFLAKIEQASNGQIKTRLFQSGALFPDLHVVKAMVQGQVEMACPGTWTITGFIPDADFSQLPGLYGRPIAEIHKATDGAAGKFVNAEVTRKLHLQVLGGWFDLGFNNWYSTKKPLTSLASLKGMKLRSPGGILNSWRIRFFGGIPNVTAWPDVPLAMSQGTFDGLITTNESANSSKLFDSGLKHSLQDHQGMGLYVPMMNMAFWHKLGPKLQETVLGLWKDNLPTYRQNTANAQAEGMKALIGHGVEFVEVSQAERDAVRAKMLPEQAKAAAWNWIERTLVGLLGAFAMIIAAVQVFGRYIDPADSINWAEEVIVYVAVWAIMIIASQLVRNDAMVRPDLVLRLLPAGVQRWVEMFNCLVAIAFTFGMVWYGWAVVSTALLLDQRSSSDLQFPMWIYYTALPTGGALMLGRYLIRLARYAFFFDPATMSVGHSIAHEAPADLTATFTE